MTHTPEPWSAGDSCMIMTNVFSGGLRVARCDFDGDHENKEGISNARRICACVNACARIETEKLEEMAKDPIAGIFGRMAANEWDKAKKYKAQRDELIEALKDVSICLEMTDVDTGAYIDDAKGKSNSAINKVKDWE